MPPAEKRGEGRGKAQSTDPSSGMILYSEWYVMHIVVRDSPPLPLPRNPQQASSANVPPTEGLGRAASQMCSAMSKAAAKRSELTWHGGQIWALLDITHPPTL